MMDSGLDQGDVKRKPRKHRDGPTEVDMEKRPISEGPSESNYNKNYAYVNSAFTESVNSVNTNIDIEAPTSVTREQYWTCSKWPLGQRILVLAVGVLGGAVIALAISLGFLGTATPPFL